MGYKEKRLEYKQEAKKKKQTKTKTNKKNLIQVGKVIVLTLL